MIGERRERSRTIEAEAVLVYCNIDPLLPSKLRMLVKGGGSSPGRKHTHSPNSAVLSLYGASVKVPIGLNPTCVYCVNKLVPTVKPKNP